MSNDNNNIVDFTTGQSVNGDTHNVVTEEPRKLPTATYKIRTFQGEYTKTGHLIASANAIIILDGNGDIMFGLPFGEKSFISIERVYENEVAQTPLL